jgi:predicted transcriptional regulator
MRIENNTLIIDNVLENENITEFYEATKQEEIEIIKVEVETISAGAVQILWSLTNSKKIEIESDFLKKFFENVKCG